MANAKKYLKNAYVAENKAADQALKKYQAQIDYTKQQALQTKNAAQTTALQDYKKYINPYGVQAEALGYKGLSNSGLSQTNLSRGWANYQNASGQANSAYQNALSQANLDMAGYISDINAQKLTNNANYQQALYEYALAHSYSTKKKSSITNNDNGLTPTEALNKALSIKNSLNFVNANAKKQTSTKRYTTTQSNNYDASTIRGNEYVWW